MANKGMAKIVREYKDILKELGEKKGFVAEKEYKYPSKKRELAKIDQVWLKNNKPIWAFEIEGGWRNKKHYKGDIINLLMFGAKHNIIILSKEGCKKSREGWDKKEFQKHFNYIKECISEINREKLLIRIEVWTEKELNKFAKK
jgi:hypothetical protein